MNDKDMTSNIGYCGKACLLCEKAVFCEGCRARKPLEARWMLRDGCYQFECCRKKGLEGCWQCQDAPCDKDVYAKTQDIRQRAFILYAKKHGVESLGKAVFINQIHGIVYGEGKDYDNLGTEENVIEVLKTGKKCKVKG